LQLDACAPADLRALVMWLVGTPVLLSMLLLAFLARSLLPLLTATRLNFYAYLSSLVCVVVLLLCFGSLCLSMLQSDASLYSS
jgi:hypothetical protein